LDEQAPPQDDDDNYGGQSSDDDKDQMEAEGAEQDAETIKKRVGPGLYTLLSMVMAGLAGKTPHMIR
jgi:hypothetical protein